MNRELSETEKLQVGEWIQNHNYAELEKWIEDDPMKAREVFSQYRSLKSLQEMEAVLSPTMEETEKAELLGGHLSEEIKEQIKRVVITYLNRGLEILSGESHRLLPEPGLARLDNGLDNGSKNGSEDGHRLLDFGNFKIEAYEDHQSYVEDHSQDAPYLLKLGKCDQVSVETDASKKIYEGKKITGFTLPLTFGKYRIIIDGDAWELELK